MKKVLIILSVLLVFSVKANCQVVTDVNAIPSEVKSKIINFFEYLLADTVDFAFHKLLKGSPISERNAQLTNLIEQTKKSFNVYGMIKGYEFVNIEKVAKSLVRIRYISLHKDFPLRWIFTFYKTEDRDWIIINIKFDDLTEYFFKDE